MPALAPPGSSAPANPFTQGLAAAAPASSDANLFGLTARELATNIGVAAPPAMTAPAPIFGVHLAPGQAPRPEPAGPQQLDPFGIGVPIQGASGNQVTVQDLLDYIQSLTPNQISQVQADLANAGYYGAINSLTTEPQWGTLGTADLKAFGSFAKDLIVSAANGGTATSLLALRGQQFNQQQQQMSSLAPVRDLGKNYTITNLDPNEAGSMVDSAAMKVLGNSLPAADRAQMSQWLNQLYTSRQRAVDQGDITQNATNAQATAQAQDFVDPVTGKALDFNGITATARSQMGIQYQWGGESPGKAFDCSGLTQWTYSQNGVQIPRTSQQQWADPSGTNFQDVTQAQPGDLVFFVGGDGTQTAPGHVGIYIGNGMMIDAPHTGSSVRLDNVQSFGGLVGFKHYAQSNNSTVAATNMPPGTANAPGQTPPGTAGGSSNAQLAYQFLYGKLVGAGQSPQGAAAQAAGIVGNLMEEDPGLNPETGQGGGGPGRGIAQWTAGLNWNPALMTGNAQLDLQNQLDFLWGDMTGNESATMVALNGVTDPQQASAIFSAKYERPGIPHNDVRAANAAQIFQQAQSGNWGAGGGSGQSTGNPGATLTGASGMDANGGRSIISTPNTFTNTFDESSAALTSSLEAQIRAMNPAMAQAHDFSNVYSMMAKSLRDGITINNT